MGKNVQETGTSPLVWQPYTAEDAWMLKQTYGMEAVYISGGTLLRTHWESGITAVPKHLIDLSAVRGVKEIRISETGFLIGGQMSLQAIRTNVFLKRHFPLVSEAIRTIAAPSVRHLATIGGNVASSVGDSIAALLAYDAEIVWYDGSAEQQTLLSDWLLTASDKNQGSERLLLSLLLPFNETEEESTRATDVERLPISKMKHFGAYHKVGRREAFTPSIVTAAIKGEIADSGELQHIRIALGGGQTIPQRLEQLETEILGASVDVPLLQHVYDRIIQLYEPREDLFASAAYRKTTAANIITSELWKSARP